MAAETGQSLYNDNCAACHQRSGLGIKGAFPTLIGGKMVTGPLPALIPTVLNGRGGMPAFKSDLTDAQMALVLSYIRSSRGQQGIGNHDGAGHPGAHQGLSSGETQEPAGALGRS